MEHRIDLDAYFKRIGYDGPPTPRYDTLAALHRLQPQAIAFEALNAFFHIETVSLDPRAIEAKLVRSKRGGWCFEQNGLFTHALRALGFEVTGLSARFLYQLPPGAETSRGHALLHVTCEGRAYLCDVGLGSLTQTGPLLFEPGLVQKTPHEDNRIGRMGEDYMIEACVKDEWRVLYRFNLAPEPPLDNFIYNHYLSTHPNSHFRSQLILARAAEEGRYSLNNRVLAFYPKQGRAEKRILSSAREAEDVLRDVFFVEPPRPLATAWDRVPFPDEQQQQQQQQ